MDALTVLFAGFLPENSMQIRKRLAAAGRKPRNRKAQDTTLINNRATAKQIAALKARITKLEQWNRLFRRRLRDKKR